MSNPIKNTLMAVIKKNNWSYMERDEVVKIDVEGKNGSWSSFARCLGENRQFLYYSAVTSKVENQRKDIVVHILTRINYGLKIGNFEMDYDTGEIHYKTAVQLGQDNVDSEIIESQIILNILTMDEYLPVLMKAIHSEECLEGLVKRFISTR